MTELKIKKVILSVTTEDDVTMRKTISGEDLRLIGSYSGELNKAYLDILSGLKERYKGG